MQDEERQAMGRNMAKALVSRLNEKDLKSSVFIVANLFNDGSQTATEEERRQLAEINLQACQEAFRMSAHELARRYANIGMSLLPNDKWTTNLATTVQLYKEASRLESCLGNRERLEALSDEILSCDYVSMEDKIPIYYAQLLSLESVDGRLEEAIDLGVRILRYFGCKFPKSKFGLVASAVASVVKIKVNAPKINATTVENLPLMTDEKMIMSKEDQFRELLLEKLPGFRAGRMSYLAEGLRCGIEAA